MGDYLVDLRDVQFILYEQLGIEKLVEFPKYADFDKETFDMVIDQALKFAKGILAPINADADKEGCRFEDGIVSMPKSFHDAYAKFSEAGWVATSTNPEWGGQGLPGIIGAVASEFFVGACCSFTMTPGLTRGTAHLIESYGTEEQKNLFCEKMYSGQWAGTMCLTEPQAGSAVGDVKTMARKEGDHYKLTGTKNFITSGDHDLTENIIHAVLARTEDAPPGIKGISLFIVPKMQVNPDGSLGGSNDIACGNIEHKMGIHASATCTLNFGDNDGCVGYLLGEENKGIRYMFQMMNEARIGVGLQGLSQAAAAYTSALQYSKERIQGTDILLMKDPNAPRVPIIEHPDVRRMLMLMKAYTEGMRALLLKTVYFVDLMEVLEDGSEKEKCNGFVELLTPICKSYCTDMGFKVTEWAIQTYGGYGYCSEYPVEQYMRDVKITSIYEGTNGIQALDLLGRKVAMKGGMLFMSFIMELNEFISANKEHSVLGGSMEIFEKAKDALAKVTMDFGQMSMSGEMKYPILHATPYLEAFGQVVLSYLLLEQAVIAHEKLEAIYKEKGADTDEAKKELHVENEEAKFYFGKIHSAQFFVTNVLPHVHAEAAAIETKNQSPLDIVF